jgi:anthraniloyl-CoA monooxygenase
VDLRPNRFAWMGSTRPFDAFTFFFRERPEGIFVAHCYQYEAGASTWVLETDPETFARAGLDAMDEAASARFMEEVFREELAGHRLHATARMWRRFPMIRCARWTRGNVVLLGDAKATAHFSIGSGTKLAMEDAIALHAAFAAGGACPSASPGSRRRGARTWSAPSTRPTCPWCGSSSSAASALPPDALRLRADDARQGDHLGQPGAARPGLRRQVQEAFAEEERARGIPADPARPPPSSRSGCAAWRCRTASSSRPCASTARRTGCRATSTWCTTARAAWAAPACCSPR